MFDTVHKRDFVSVSNWPLKSLNQQQGVRWRAGVMHLAPAGHWWSSWRTTDTPTGYQRTCQIKVDCPCPRWHGLQSPLLHWPQVPPICNSVCCLKGLLWILKYTSYMHQSWGPHYQEEVTMWAKMALWFICWNDKLFILSVILVVFWWSVIRDLYWPWNHHHLFYSLHLFYILSPLQGRLCFHPCLLVS